MRLAIHADRHAAFAHAAQLWQAERRLHLRTGPWLNGLAAARPRARRGGRVLLRAAALSGHPAGAGLAVLAQACGSTARPAALGAGAGHDRRERGVLGLAGRPAPARGARWLRPWPWRGLLFAYAAGQLAGRLVPLPGGLGGVEGGVLGALTLTGISPAAAAAAVIVYRVAGYWAVGAAGTAAAATLGRRRSRGTGGSSPAASGLH